MSISVIIPTLNEEAGIGKTLSDMPNPIIDEILVVDSSTDKTREIAKSFDATVIHESRKGYGRALQTGIQNSKGEIVVYIDADYTYDPKEIEKIVQPILDGQRDVILGNRLKNMLPRSMSSFNKFGNFALSLIFTILFLKRVGDTQCGLRAIRRQFLEDLSYQDYGMPYVTEQLIKLLRRGAKIGEVPITYRPRIGDTKLCSWTDGFRILKTILKGRFDRP